MTVSMYVFLTDFLMTGPSLSLAAGLSDFVGNLT